MLLPWYHLNGLLLICSSFFLFMHGDEQHHHDIAHAQTRKIFGTITSGTNLPTSSIDSIEELIYQLMTTSPLQQYNAARFAFMKLQQEQKKLTTTIKKLKQADKIVSLDQWHEDLVRTVQLNHLQRVLQELHKQLSLKEKARITSDTFLRNKGQSNQLGDLLVHYYTIERTAILSDYQKSLNFFAAQNRTPLPRLMQAWHTPYNQQRLLQEIRLLNPRIAVQFASLLVDIGMQIALTSGESYTEKLFAEDDQKQYKILMDQQTALQRRFQAFQADSIQKTTDNITKQGQIFSKKFDEINQQRGVAQQELSKEIDYLMRSINLDLPETHYVTAPITYDNYFGASKMIVMPDMAPWYNIFQTNWLFDTKTKSFIQQDLVPFGSSFEATQQSIFTEYITGKASYTIEAEITIIDCMYPFFAGIMFNKARWLSGSEERMHQYRLAGLYGTSDKNIILTFAQTTSKKHADNSPAITIPLNLISDATTRTTLFTLPPEETKNIGENPLTFSITIQNSLNSITITLFKKIGTKKTQLSSRTIDNLNLQESRLLFWYHGIGFMSPGCQAMFTIIQPNNVLQQRGA
jgi:hypothetical protein